MRLPVAPFDKCAIMVYERAGFQLQERVSHEVDRKLVEILRMRKRLTKRDRQTVA